MARRFKQFLNETPINDYETVGNFNKSHSFRHETDRKMITSPKAIQNARKKFSKTSYEFNFIFVNTKEANKHTEVGHVSLQWVQQNLGNEVAQSVSKYLDKDDINIIFTNNKGDERVPMTPWMMAHRIAHAIGRENGSRTNRAFQYAEEHLLNQVEMIFNYYNVNRSFHDVSRNRRSALAMMYLFHELATFKSARDKNLRDWFEVLNELIAQHLITGTIKFNPPPQSFSGGSRGSKQSFYLKDEDKQELSDFMETFARDMNHIIGDIFGACYGKIFVM